MAARQNLMRSSFEKRISGLSDNMAISLIIVKPVRWFGCFSTLEEQSVVTYSMSSQDRVVGMMMMMTMQMTVTGMRAKTSRPVLVSREASLEATRKEVQPQERVPQHHGVASGVVPL
jgi:hypothetical protein